MKYLFTIFSMLFVFIRLNAQTLIEENFSGSFPPAGWTIENHSENWSAAQSANAGGNAPEARFSWSPQFIGTSRLVIPIDLTGINKIGVTFRHSIDHYGGVYSVGVASNSAGSAVWDNEWRVLNPSSSIAGEKVWLAVTNNTNASDFKLSWFFEGNSYNINYWYIDDVKIFIPYDHDVLVDKINIDSQVSAGNPIIPSATIRNIGSNTESFDVSCKIYSSGGSEVFNDTKTVSSLAADNTVNISFNSFNPSITDELYRVEITTMLSGDGDISNDTAENYFDTNTFQRVALWEEFTSTTCSPCASANPVIKSMLADYGQDKIVAIFWHVWWPSPGNDPFFHANETQNTERTSDYYGVSAVPDSYVDGILGPQPGNSGSMTAAVDQRLNKFTSLNMYVGYKETGDQYLVRVNLDAVGGVRPGDYKLRLVAIENGIEYTGTNGESNHEYVFRQAYPTTDGTPFSINKGESLSFDFDCPVNPEWDPRNLQFIAFVQDDITKEVVQAALGVNDPNLPVELTTLTAEQNETKILLRWTTATETNNQGFEIQRKTVGTSGEESAWQELAFKEGRGTTTDKTEYSYTDDIAQIKADKIIYRLKQIDFDSQFSYSDEVEISNVAPIEFALYQNYPNPFNPTTSIKFDIPEAGFVSLKVFDLLGKEAARLVNEQKEPGRYSVNFDASSLGTGLYFYVIRVNDYSSVRKMMLLK